MVSKSDSIEELRISLEKEIKGHRKSIIETLALLVLFLCMQFYEPLRNDHNPMGRLLTPAAIVLLSAVLIIELTRLGIPRFMSIALVLPASPAKESMPLMLKLVPFIVPRSIVTEKIDAAIQDLSPEEAKQIDDNQWETLYRYFWKGSPEQKQILLRVASLLGNDMALPYLQKMLSSKATSPELKSSVEQAIADIKSA